MSATTASRQSLYNLRTKHDFQSFTPRGCSITDTVVTHFVAPDATEVPASALTATPTAAVCYDNGQIDVAFVGGGGYTGADNWDVQLWEWADGAVGALIESVTSSGEAPTALTFTNVTRGEYRVFMVKVGEYEWRSGVITVDGPDAPLEVSIGSSRLSAGEVHAKCEGDSVTLEAIVSGGETDYTYAWTNSSSMGLLGTNPTLDATDDVVIHLEVTDFNGCTAQAAPLEVFGGVSTTHTVNASAPACTSQKTGILEVAVTAEFAEGGITEYWYEECELAQNEICARCVPAFDGDASCDGINVHFSEPEVLTDCNWRMGFGSGQHVRVVLESQHGCVIAVTTTIPETLNSLCPPAPHQLCRVSILP